ncbi:MAG: phospho-sugar mutase [Firmicutes bacterium]|nr:phospho-sugar mutase [Bacillota bacterium]
MWEKTYQKWLNFEGLDSELKNDMIGKTNIELEEMFYTSLEFGTGGMRGILGAGTNRLNIYTIRKANDGLARYLRKRYGINQLNRGVVIAYDNRKMSKEFAEESAKVLGYYGIKTYIFDTLRPTPELSFATRLLNALAGIVVTASHNPPQYNGYKIYDEFGCQFTPIYADVIVEMVNEVEDVFSIPVRNFLELKKEGLVEMIGKDVDDKYLKLVKSIQLHPQMKKNIKIVFTPLHGTSALLGTRLLQETNYEFYPVKAQMVHDPFFSTVKSPNPENPEAFHLAIELGKKVDADLLIATDPDADRLGIAVKNDGNYILLTGNQTGAILLYYLLNEKKKLGLLPQKGVVFNTIVTSDLGAKIARSFGYEVISTLTGFKYIGEQARFLESTDKQFLFGYEESFGYVINDGVRDKDSLQAMLLAAEAASYYKETEHKTLYEKLGDLFDEFGAYYEDLHNINLLGLEGKRQIDRIMTYFRKHHLDQISHIKVSSIEDYETSIKYEGKSKSTLLLPKSNVIKYILKNGLWFVLRPSGTEPKLKIYVGGNDVSFEKAKTLVKEVSKELLKLVNQVK